LVDGASDTRRQRDDGELGSFAEHGEGAVTAFEGKVFDVDVARFSDAKAAQPKKTSERVIDDTSSRPLGEERTELHPIQTESLRLVGDLGSADELERRVLEVTVDHCDAVEAGQGREPAADGCLGETADFFHLARPQLHMRALYLEGS
jgi:hypothetical protein